MRISPSNRGEALAFTWIGPPLTVAASWFLFAKLRFHEAPGLFHHFPGVYILVISVALSGVVLLVMGLLALRKYPATP
jgi:hypothetical protein